MASVISAFATPQNRSWLIGGLSAEEWEDYYLLSTYVLGLD